MINFKYAPNITRGDLILVTVYGAILQAGVFSGYSSANNVQYWLLTPYNAEKILAGKKIYKAYISGDNQDIRVAKISEDILSPEEKVVYKTFKEKWI